ncbi:Golgi apyrase [Irineochytrium annulatum]|nr:Golgi apyrase [Irineochytrium annulatum]
MDRRAILIATFVLVITVILLLNPFRTPTASSPSSSSKISLADGFDSISANSGVTPIGSSPSGGGRFGGPHAHPNLPSIKNPDDEAILNLDTGYSPDTVLSSADGRITPPPSEGATPSQRAGTSTTIAPVSEWDRDRLYGIVIDAGSSGSRALIYSWRDPRKVRVEASRRLVTTAGPGLDALDRLPRLEKADPTGTNWSMSIEPGISSLANNPSPLAVAEYLKPLFTFAASIVPPRKIEVTPIYLLATAGMRLIAAEPRAAILAAACELASRTYGFSVGGGCSMHFRVISGELEGIFGWVTVNYLKGGFENVSRKDGVELPSPASYGFLDMGGASTQIAFEPEGKEEPEDLTRVRLRTIRGVDVEYWVFSTTFLGFGVNEARRRYVEELGRTYQEELRSLPGGSVGKDDRGANLDKRGIRKGPKIPAGTGQAWDDEAVPDDAYYDDDSKLARSEEDPDVSAQKVTPVRTADNWTKPSINDPCLPPGLLLAEPRLVTITTNSMEQQPHHLLGTGSLSTCLSLQLPLLNKSHHCLDEPCLFNGVHGPRPSFKTLPVLQDKHRNRFVGASEYFYTPASVGRLLPANASAIDPTTSSLDPVSFRKAVERLCSAPWSQLVAMLEASRTAGESGLAAAGLRIDEDRLKMQCFKSAWLLTVLHEGFGAPRDRGVVEPVEVAAGFPISWTVGAMLLHVASTISREVTPGGKVVGGGGAAGATWGWVWRAMLVLAVVGLIIVVGAGYLGARVIQRRRRGSKPITGSCADGRGMFAQVPAGDDMEMEGGMVVGGNSIRAVGPGLNNGVGGVGGIPLTRVGVGVGSSPRTNGLSPGAAGNIFAAGGPNSGWGR